MRALPLSLIQSRVSVLTPAAPEPWPCTQGRLECPWRLRLAPVFCAYTETTRVSNAAVVHHRQALLRAACVRADHVLNARGSKRDAQDEEVWRKCHSASLFCACLSLAFCNPYPLPLSMKQKGTERHTNTPGSRPNLRSPHPWPGSMRLCCKRLRV